MGSDLDGAVTASLLERRAYHLGEVRSYANAVLRLSPGHHVSAMATAVLSAADALGANPDSDEHRADLVSCVLALSLALSGTPQDSLH